MNLRPMVSQRSFVWKEVKGKVSEYFHRRLIFPRHHLVLQSNLSRSSGGSVWVIGTNTVPGGYGIYQWAGNNWASRSGGATRIDVGSEGDPWVVNSSDEIFHWEGTGWRHLSGRAKDIGVGASGTWVIGTNAVPGGYGIYRWTGANWSAVPGGATEITVAGF